MNKTQRVILSSLFVLVVGGINAARIANQNGPAFQQHPIASVLGGVCSAILVGIGLYWFLGILDKRRRPDALTPKSSPLKMSGRIPLVIALISGVAFVFLVWVAVDDSLPKPAGLRDGSPPPSGILGGSAQQPARLPEIVPPQSGDVNGSPEKPTRLPYDVIQNCKFKGGPTGNGNFEVEVYNGSPHWFLSEIIITIKAGEEPRVFRLVPLRDGRVVQYDTSGRTLTSAILGLPPLSTGRFSGTIGTFLDGLKQGEWQFLVGEVTGYKQ